MAPFGVSWHCFLLVFFLMVFLLGSADVEKLKKLVLHNPYILTLPEVGNIKDEIIPKSVQQFSVRTIY